MANEKKGVKHSEPEMRSTGNTTKENKENSAITDATQIRPSEVFDSAKYNAMSDMVQGATLDTGNVEALSKPQEGEVLKPRQISKNSLTDVDNIGSNDNTQTTKITPMTIEERARTIREVNEEVRQQPLSSPSLATIKQSPSQSSSSAYHPESRTDKFVLYLNLMLSVEIAAVERLHARIQQSPLAQVRQQLSHHLEETRNQKERLILLITKLGGQPTGERAQLPNYSPPKSLADILNSSAITPEEQELKTLEIDTIIEHAEIIGYNTLIQIASKLNIGEAIPPLRQSLKEEEEMAAWARANLPSNFIQLWMKNW